MGNINSNTNDITAIALAPLTGGLSLFGHSSVCKNNSVTTAAVTTAVLTAPLTGGLSLVLLSNSGTNQQNILSNNSQNEENYN